MQIRIQQNPAEILNNLNKKSARLAKKVLVSATANAENNFKMDKEKLYVKEAYINEGRTLKRGRAGAKGMPKPILRSDVLKFEDLKIGMELTGTVRNVVDFGAFVDVGVKHDGLVHISEITEKFVKDVNSYAKIGESIYVEIKEKDDEKKKFNMFDSCFDNSSFRNSLHKSFKERTDAI